MHVSCTQQFLRMNYDWLRAGSQCSVHMTRCLHISFWRSRLFCRLVSAVITSSHLLPTGFLAQYHYIHLKCLNEWWCCEEARGVSMMQHGHLTSLQLEAMNQCISALHGSSSGCCTIVRHKGHRSWSGLFELATICSSCHLIGRCYCTYDCNDLRRTIVGWSACCGWRLLWWFWMTCEIGFTYTNLQSSKVIIVFFYYHAVNCCVGLPLTKGILLGPCLWCLSITSLHW